MVSSIWMKTAALIALSLIYVIGTVACGLGSNKYQLDITVKPAGAASISLIPEPDNDGKYPADMVVTISITPSPGYDIDTWEGHVSDKHSVITTVTMNADQLLELQLTAASSPSEGSMETETYSNENENSPEMQKGISQSQQTVIADSNSAIPTETSNLIPIKDAPINIVTPESSQATPRDSDETEDLTSGALNQSSSMAPVEESMAPVEESMAPVEESITIVPAPQQTSVITDSPQESEPDLIEPIVVEPVVETTVTGYSLTVGEALVTTTTLELDNSTISIFPGPNGPEGSYLQGTNVQITVTGKTGNILSSFSHPSCSSLPTCMLTVDRDLTVDLVFLKTYSISINASQVVGSPILLLNGRIDISPPNAPANRYHSGTVVSLIPQADLGFQFAGWDGACVGIGSCSILVNENWDELTASFKSASLPDWSHQTLSLSSKLIKSDGDTVIATIFTQDDGSPTVTNVSFSLTNPANVTENKQGSPCGSSVSGNVTNKCWNSVFSIPANSTISNQIYKLVVSSPTMTNSPEIRITVEGSTYPLTINGPIVTSNTISLTGGIFSMSEAPNGMNNMYLSGTQVIITAIPNEGFEFSGWTGDCSGTDSCVVIMNTDRSITGMFSSL